MSTRITGTVVPGQKIGKQHGLPPTMNIAVSHMNEPLEFGIYVVTLARDNRILHGVAHFGPRPAVQAPDSFEVHCFDFDEDWYGATVEIEVLKFLRPVSNFESIELLKQQILQDIVAGREFFA